MRITSGGNVGIGTSSPAQILHLQGSGTTYMHIGNSTTGSASSDGFDIGYFSGETALNIVQRENDSMIFSTNNTERMRITSGGNVGIGVIPSAFAGLVRGFQVGFGASFSGNTASPDAYMTSNCYYDGSNWRYINSGSFAQSYDARGSGGEYFWLNAPSGTAGGVVTFTERMKLTASGSLIVNNLGTGLVYSSSGALTSTNPSDERLKNNIEDISWGLSDILKLRPVSYFWKDDKINQGVQFGFIAQEVQEVMPEAIKEFGEDVKYLGLEKDAIYATLVKAVQELEARIKQLENK
jgi:hypothetical protein